MIVSLNGVIDYVEEDRVYMEVQGIGYEVRVTKQVLDSITSTGMKMKIYTYMSVREDDVSLFGFISREELNIFKMLIKVNGIGPKGGLGILSAMSVDVLRFAILSGDSKTIAKAPGIGKKTAEKLILELRDKFDIENMMTTDNFAEGISADNSNVNSNATDAVEALVALGYSNVSAMKVVKAIKPDETMTTEEIIKQALKRI